MRTVVLDSLVTSSVLRARELVRMKKQLGKVWNSFFNVSILLQQEIKNYALSINFAHISCNQL